MCKGLPVRCQEAAAREGGSVSASCVLPSVGSVLHVLGKGGAMVFFKPQMHKGLSFSRTIKTCKKNVKHAKHAPLLHIC